MRIRILDMMKELEEKMKMVRQLGGEKRLEKLELIEQDYSRLKAMEKAVSDFRDKNILKVALIGGVGVGKSSFLTSLLPRIRLTEQEKVKVEKRGDKKIKKPLPFSKLVEKQSFLPISSGRTTLSKIEVILSPQVDEVYIKVKSKPAGEVEEIIEDYLTYHFADDTERQSLFFSEEMDTFIMNVALKDFLEKRPGFRKYREKIKKERKEKTNKATFTEADVIDYFHNVLIPENPGVKDQLRKFLYQKLINDVNFEEVSIHYNEKIFQKLFKNRFRNEDSFNKSLRFLKKILEVLNKGKFDTKAFSVSIPELIKVYIPAKGNYTYVFLDTKGTEIDKQGTFINRAVVDLAKDLSFNVLFFSRQEDAPSIDVKEILSDKYLKEMFSGRSKIVISVKNEYFDENDYTKIKKTFLNTFAEFKDDVVFYNSFKAIEEEHRNTLIEERDILEVIRELDKKRLAKIRRYIKTELERLHVELDLLISTVDSRQAEELSKAISFLDDEKERIADEIEEKKEIFFAVEKAVINSHHSIVHATFKKSRKGDYFNLDLVSLIRVKSKSILKKNIERLKDFFQEVLDRNDVVDKSLFNAETFNKAREYLINEILSYTQKQADRFIDEIITDLRAEYRDNEWEQFEKQWGLGNGYMKRIHTKLYEIDLFPLIDRKIAGYIREINLMKSLNNIVVEEQEAWKK